MPNDDEIDKDKMQQNQDFFTLGSPSAVAPNAENYNTNQANENNDTTAQSIDQNASKIKKERRPRSSRKGETPKKNANP